MWKVGHMWLTKPNRGVSKGKFSPRFRLFAPTYQEYSNMGASNVQSSKRDTEVAAVFQRKELPQQKKPIAVCKYCKNTKTPYLQAWNTTRLRQHLLECDPCHKVLQERGESNSVTQEREQRQRHQVQSKLSFMQQENATELTQWSWPLSAHPF